MTPEKVMQLQEPVAQGSQMITELRIRKPKAGDMRALPGKPEMTHLLDLGGRLCGQPPSVINELSVPDMMELLEIVGNFITPGQKTGASG